MQHLSYLKRRGYLEFLHGKSCSIVFEVALKLHDYKGPYLRMTRFCQDSYPLNGDS